MKKFLLLTAIAVLFSSFLISNTTSTVTADPTVTTPHRNLTVKVLECTRNGDNVDLIFLLQNDGTDLEMFDFHPSSAYGSKVVDNLGNTIKFFSVSDGSSAGAGVTKRISLPNGVPVKLRVRMLNVPADASSLALVQLNSKTYMPSSTYAPEGNFVFKNYPIQ